MNSDGFDDIIVGSTPRRTTVETPVTYLIYGAAAMTLASITTMTPTQGLSISGGGQVVSEARDTENKRTVGVLIGSGLNFFTGGGFVLMHTNETLSSPSVSPVPVPSQSPSRSPTRHPSWQPSLAPTPTPSVGPTTPTLTPSVTPTGPSELPTMEPSQPTSSPSVTPTAPSAAPSIWPSTEPSDAPTVAPSMRPSTCPTHKPTTSPSLMRTHVPTVQKPTLTPSAVKRTSYPIVHPTMRPTRGSSLAPLTVFEEITEGQVVTRQEGYTSYTINTTAVVEFVGSAGHDVFAVVPDCAALVYIYDFNKTDKIDMRAFTEFHSMSELSLVQVKVATTQRRTTQQYLRGLQTFQCSSVILNIEDAQIIFEGMCEDQLTDSNFIFAGPPLPVSWKIPHELIYNDIIAQVVGAALCFAFVAYVAFRLWKMEYRHISFLRVLAPPVDVEHERQHNKTFVVLSNDEDSSEESESDSDSIGTYDAISNESLSVSPQPSLWDVVVSSEDSLETEVTERSFDFKVSEESEKSQQKTRANSSHNSIEIDVNQSCSRSDGTVISPCISSTSSKCHSLPMTPRADLLHLPSADYLADLYCRSASKTECAVDCCEEDIITCFSNSTHESSDADTALVDGYSSDSDVSN